MSNKPRKIGLISDTHGLLRPEALRALKGSELIIHAGDVGDPRIIPTLETLAPVIGVRGNIDTGPWALALPMTQVVEIDGGTLYVLHDVQALDLNPSAAGFSAVISGHSHRPGNTIRDGIMYINPGSAGPRRFQLPVTIARLDATTETWEVEFTQLLPTGKETR